MNRSAKILCGVGLLSLVACTDSHGEAIDDGSSKITPNDSTETGNPPVIDLALVALVVTSDEVHIVGEEGAVTPGGIEVEIETLASGDRQRGPVAKDGSFDVRVDGSPDDTYAVRALGGSAMLVSDPVFVYRGGAMVGGEDGGMLSCEQRSEIIVGQLAELERDLDKSCTSNAECTRLALPDDCGGFWGCGGPIASTTASAERAAALAAIGENLCEAFAADHCVTTGNACPAPSPLACIQGQCTPCAGGACPTTSCEDACDTPIIEWSENTAPGETTSATLLDCATLSSTPGCTTGAPCAPAGGAEVSVIDVQNALAAPDVQEALANHTRFGAPDPSTEFSVTIGDGSFSFTRAPCDGMADCVDLTYGVAYLATVLRALTFNQRCEGTPAPTCEQPFDPGTGSESIAVWAFHPQSGACVPRTYSGSGGNDNRFDMRAECEAACPNPFDSSSCPPNRTYAENVCFECGLAGGCPESGTACVKLCTTNDDCADEWGWCGGRGFCEVFGCD